jgi:hypothetical protein
MNGGGRAIVLDEPVNEALRTTVGGGKCCGVKRQVLGPRFICQGAGTVEQLLNPKRPVAEVLLLPVLMEVKRWAFLSGGGEGTNGLFICYRIGEKAVHAWRPAGVVGFTLQWRL